MLNKVNFRFYPYHLQMERTWEVTNVCRPQTVIVVIGIRQALLFWNNKMRQ